MKCSILSPVVVCSAVILASALALAKPAPARKKKVLATGQTTAYQARNNGDLAPVDVPDDGTVLCDEKQPRRFWQRWTLNALNWTDLVCQPCVHTWLNPPQRKEA